MNESIKPIFFYSFGWIVLYVIFFIVLKTPTKEKRRRKTDKIAKKYYFKFHYK